MWPDTPLTKKQLGWLLCLAGVGLAVAVLAVDWMQAGNFAGFGPMQQRAIGGAGAIVVFGLTLVARGEQLA